MTIVSLSRCIAVLSLLTLADGSAQPPPPPAAAAAEAAKIAEKESSANKKKAKIAWDSDQKNFGTSQFSELEKQYQEINSNYKTPQIKDLLINFIAKWKKGNRVGCVTLYLAQKSSGELREKLLKQCAGEFSDCYYLDGTQVGGLGRLYLASYYKQAGKEEEVAKLTAELRTNFPSAQDHARARIVDLLSPLEK